MQGIAQVPCMQAFEIEAALITGWLTQGARDKNHESHATRGGKLHS